MEYTYTYNTFLDLKSNLLRTDFVKMSVTNFVDKVLEEKYYRIS